MNKSKILFVDDEKRILRSLDAAFKFEDEFEVYTSNSAEEALRLVKGDQFHVIISDQRMPEVTGVELLEKVREVSPNTMRILLTGYADMDAIISSINEGEVFRYITKPWNNKELKDTVYQASRIASQYLNEATPLSKTKKEDHTPDFIKGTEIPILSDPLEISANVITQDNTNINICESLQEGILVLEFDEKAKSISEFVKTEYESQYPISIAHNMDQTIESLSQKKIAVVVACLGTGRGEISTLLKLLKKEYPLANTLAVADRADADEAIALINQGQVYRYLPKPVSKGRLKLSINSALVYYNKCKQNPTLLARHFVESVQSEQEPSPWLDRFVSAMSKLTRRKVD